MAVIPSTRGNPVCLCMIVRDEASSITQCLASVLPFISHWAIVDTGSQDTTPEIVRAMLNDLPGKLICTAWHGDFSYHRNQSVNLAIQVVRDSALRLLFLDADEQLVVLNPGKFRRALNERASFCWWAVDGDWYSRKLGVVALDEFDVWSGEIHEFVVLRNPQHAHRLVQRYAHVLYGHSGFRRREMSTAQIDSNLLKAAVARDPKVFRNNFFLARTLEASQQCEAAASYFRAAHDCDDAMLEDRWQALWGLGRVLMPFDISGASATFLLAHELLSTRAEPLVSLAEVARLQGQYAQALTLAGAALACREPTSTSMYDRSAYGWRATDEICLSGLLLGDSAAMQTAVDGYTDILCRNALPLRERNRVLTNLQLLLDRL